METNDIGLMMGVGWLRNLRCCSFLPQCVKKYRVDAWLLRVFAPNENRTSQKEFAMLAILRDLKRWHRNVPLGSGCGNKRYWTYDGRGVATQPALLLIFATVCQKVSR
ncbi:MAG: hypothetical protein ACI4R8_02730 [Candidatus Caccovivens sp.]